MALKTIEFAEIVSNNEVIVEVGISVISAGSPRGLFKADRRTGVTKAHSAVELDEAADGIRSEPEPNGGWISGYVINVLCENNKRALHKVANDYETLRAIDNLIAHGKFAITSGDEYEKSIVCYATNRVKSGEHTYKIQEVMEGLNKKLASMSTAESEVARSMIMSRLANI